MYRGPEHTYRSLAAACLGRGDQRAAQEYERLADENRWLVDPPDRPDPS